MPVVEGPASILVVTGDDATGDDVIACLGEAGHRCSRSHDICNAREMLLEREFDLLLLDTTLPGDVLALISDAQARCPWLRAIAWSTAPDPESAITAIRHGATDFLQFPKQLADLAKRSNRAVAQGRSHRQREQRLQRLMLACESLKESKEEMSKQVDVLCSDLASAYRTIKDQMSIVEMTTEFRTLISQELDVEDMLRTSLEYMLKKVGPTNGVVYLREAEGSYGIGAFVNYEWQDRNILPSLECLGGTLCSPMQGESGLMKFEDTSDFARCEGVDEAIFTDSEVVAFSCNWQGTCLAVITLFRNAKTPFTDEMASMLDALREILAEQLGRILRVHKRSMLEWPEDSCDDSDWNDLAA
jgi:DNA-binding response OmpR family regulator